MQKNDESNKPDMAKEISDCGMCRANGIPPPCSGHGGKGGGGSGGGKGGGGSGGGGGGSGSGGGGSEGKKEELKVSTNKPRINNISLYLLQSATWTQVSALDKTLVFSNPEALLSLKIDSGNGVLEFRGNYGLFKDQEKTLNEFFKKIISEFDEFKKENKITDENYLAESKNNILTIRIPNKNLYDLFVERLIEKNLIATPDNLMLSKNLQHKNVESEKIQRSFPNPFDTSKGPQPKGAKKKLE